MNTKLKEIIRQLLVSPLRFPVEAALGLAFFIMAVWHSESAYPMSETVKQLGNILWLFVPLMTLSFWLQRINRWVYYVSFFLFIPLMALDLEPFLETYGFRFTYVLAAILLIIGNKKLDNRSFAAHALHVVTQMFFGVMITGIFNLVVMAICASFFYIFGIDEPRHFYEHIIQFVWFVLAPQICCTFVRQNEDEVVEPFKVLRLILNFILSPAIIIYTVILYIYFIKIALEWDLPKGGVAWMVMGFISAALVGRMAQSILSQRYYDWFYRYFTLIAIPPLIMYWIGSIYRIRIYNFTESRFYLMVAGVLMTLFVLMLFWKRTRRYQWMAFIFGTAIILFTYIPGISAKSIGLNCQKQRLQEIINMINDGGDMLFARNRNGNITYISDINNQSKNVNVKKDATGNKAVQDLIEQNTGYTVSGGYNSIFLYYTISHIWANATDPRYFTNIWNIAIVTTWANFLLDKNGSKDELTKKVINTFNAICIKHYDMQAMNLALIDIDINKLMPKTRFVVHGTYTINVIHNKRKGQDYGKITQVDITI